MNSQEIIKEIEKLPPDERRAVIQHFEGEMEEHFTTEVIDELIERKNDAKQGLNMSDSFRADDITSPLKNLMR